MRETIFYTALPASAQVKAETVTGLIPGSSAVAHAGAEDTMKP
jgi:hypothetical protein